MIKNRSFSIGFVLSITMALLYIVGFVCLFVLFTPLTDNDLTQNEHFNYVVVKKTYLQVWYLFIYILFGILLIPLTVIINNFFSDNKMNKITAIFGYVWSAFVLASGFIFIIGIENISSIHMTENNKLIIWKTLEILQEALGGGIELIGGIWVFLIGLNAYLNKKFSAIFNVFSMFLGCIGIITVIPGLFGFGGVFGLLQIIWFITLGFLFHKENNKL